MIEIDAVMTDSRRRRLHPKAAESPVCAAAGVLPTPAVLLDCVGMPSAAVVPSITADGDEAADWVTVMS